MMKYEIVEKRLTGDYRVWVEGRSDIWQIGKDIDEAIGRLIRSRQLPSPEGDGLSVMTMATVD